MHLQRQNGIPPTISIDPIDDHETYTVRKRQKKNNQKKIHTIIPFFAYCHWKETHTYLLPLWTYALSAKLPP